MKIEPMGRQLKQQLPALVCAAALLAMILIAQPVGEVPVSDDVSFIFSAKVLEHTGHIAYNGFVSPILGWQLYWGALFLRVFGDSFHVARVSISVLAVLAAYLCHRTMVRAGVSAWNATAATLTLVLSPMFAEISTAFMTDVPALIAIVLCIYACIRTLQARTSAAAIGWIGFAALSNVVLGSVRQTAWMGVLVVLPCLLWLVRRRREVFRAGIGFLLLSVALIAAMLHWFAQQPYTMTEALLPPAFTPHFFLQMSLAGVRMVLQMGLFLLPVLLVFVPSIIRGRTPWPVVVLAAGLFVVAVVLARGGHLAAWAAPYLGRSFWWPFTTSVSLALTAVVVVCLLALGKDLLTNSVAVEQRAQEDEPAERLPLHSLFVLLVPLGLANAALLVLRAGFTAFWDRYTLPLLFIALVLLMRFYQQRRQGSVPVIAFAAALVFGVYGAGLVHDDFAERRAALAVANEVEASGVPRTQIKGDWDYDELTELMITGHVYAPHMRLPKGATVPASTHYGIPNCQNFFCDMFPHVLPEYAISHAAEPGFTQYAPVSYSTWILPAGTLYVVRFP